jgi:transcription termination factor Rho
MIKELASCRPMHRQAKRHSSRSNRRRSQTGQVLRRVLMPMGTSDGLELLINKLKESKSNSKFFDQMNT